MEEQTYRKTNTSMNKAYIISASVIVILLVAYWFFYRPTHIRSTCDKRARDFAQIGDTATYTVSKYTPTYTACLHQHGL